MFSDENGLTCAVKLDDLPVHFSDLFIPLRVPAQFEVNIFFYLLRKHWSVNGEYDDIDGGLCLQDVSFNP